MQTFQPWSSLHALVALVAMLLIAAAIIEGRRRRNAPGHPRALRRFEQLLGVLGLILWMTVNTYWMSRAQFEPRHALPLHICDLAGLSAPLGLLTRWRPLRTLTYFWGIGLCTQAFITPQLREGPANPQFWFFWLTHTTIVLTAAYELAVARYRPRWRDFALAVIATLAYLAIVLPIDVAFDFNYGYVGRGLPRPGTIADVLGPWPLRVVWMAALVAMVFIVLTLPWVVLRAHRRSEAED